MSDAEAFDRTGERPRLKEPKRYRASLAVWCLLLAYASLYPLIPLRPPGGDAIAGFFGRPKYITGFDVALNVLAYVPLGTLACLHFLQQGARIPAIVKAALLGTAFSFAMEAAQLFIPTRIATLYDVLANGAGALVGAMVFSEPWYSTLTRPVGELRERMLIEGQWGDAGLVLVMLWLIAQLNPALPFFGAGNIVTEDDNSTAAAILQWSGVALSICGFGLFISALLRGPQGALRVTLVLLSIALWLKFVTAATMLKPQLSADWVNEVRVIGLAAGLLLFIPLRVFSLRTRTYLAILLMLAGTLFARVVGDYSPMDDLLRLFNWPHGQLATFASLTRYLHEVWPLLALGYLIARFVARRREDAVR